MDLLELKMYNKYPYVVHGEATFLRALNIKSRSIHSSLLPLVVLLDFLDFARSLSINLGSYSCVLIVVFEFTGNGLHLKHWLLRVKYCP